MIEPRDSVISDIDDSLRELIWKFDTEKSDDPEHAGRHRISVLEIRNLQK